MDNRYFDQFFAIYHLIDDKLSASIAEVTDEVNIGRVTVTKRLNEMVAADVLKVSKGRPLEYSIGDASAWQTFAALNNDDLIADGIAASEQETRWKFHADFADGYRVRSKKPYSHAIRLIVRSADETRSNSQVGFYYTLADAIAAGNEAGERWKRDYGDDSTVLIETVPFVAYDHGEVEQEASPAPVEAPSAPVAATMVTSAPEEPVEAPTPSVPVRTPLEWVENAEAIMRHDLDRPALLFVNVMPGQIKDIGDKIVMLEAMNKQGFIGYTGAGGYWRGFDSVDEAMLVKLKLEGSDEFPFPISLVERPSKTIESVIANAVAEAGLIYRAQYEAKIAALEVERDEAREREALAFHRANAAETMREAMRALVTGGVA